MTGNPPICIAINHHDIETVRLLIKANCDVNAKGNGQTTALHQAISHRYDILTVSLHILYTSGLDTNIQHLLSVHLDKWKYYKSC